MVAASTAPDLDNLVINVGSGVETSVRELVSMVLQVTTSKAEVMYNPRTDPGVSRMCADLTLAAISSATSRVVSLDEGLRLTMRRRQALPSRAAHPSDHPLRTGHMTPSFWIILLTVFVYGLVHSLLASLWAKAQARRWFGPAADRWFRLLYNLLASRYAAAGAHTADAIPEPCSTPTTTSPSRCPSWSSTRRSTNGARGSWSFTAPSRTPHGVRSAAG